MNAVSATLLLPASGRFDGVALPSALGRALARADLAVLPAGEGAQLERHVSLVPASDAWPVAALTRQRDAGDAGDVVWLRADPCFVAADMQGVRLLAHGPALALTAAEAEGFAAELAPVFAEHGLGFSAPDPSRWYVRLPAGVATPAFVAVDDVLGDDLFDHLPEGGQGRLWRSLLTHTQMLLHQMPLNVARHVAGKAMVNSLWFWGAGAMPDTVVCPYGQVRSPDPLLQALAAQSDAGAAQRQLVDLRHLRDGSTAIDQALMPLLDAVDCGEVSTLVLDFADGVSYTLRARQRWRFWRGVQKSLRR